MNDARLNGKQVEETQDGGALDADVLDDETLGDGDGGEDAERMRLHRLRGFLRELVREEGKMEAAELLGVNYKTLDRAEKTGEITGRMGDAIERLSSAGDNPEVMRLRESFGEVEERIAALETGMESLVKQLRDGLGELRAAVSGRSDVSSRDDTGEKEAGKSETGAAPAVAGLRPKKSYRERRKEPEVVTVEPAEDDQEVYGDAWPLIDEWRTLRADHPHRGKNLSSLRKYERLLVLELEMLEEHELTLPPEKQALRGFGRRGQTSWRWTALFDTRKSLARRELLRWVLPWLWRE